MKIFKNKDSKYEGIIKTKIKLLEETRLAYLNQVNSLLKDIEKGDNIHAYAQIDYAITTINQCSYEIKLLKDILKEARA